MYLIYYTSIRICKQYDWYEKWKLIQVQFGLSKDIRDIFCL